MNYIHSEEWEFANFFEIEPTLLENDIPWVYNQANYRRQINDHDLSFSIAPANKEVSIVLKFKDKTIYEFKALGIRDVKIISEKNNEILIVYIGEQESIILRIKPNIAIVQEINRET